MSPQDSTQEFDWRIPAAEEPLEQVCHAVMQVLEARTLAGKDRFAVLLLLREALNNALIHGGKRDPGRLIDCRFSISDGEAVIDVADSGSGFNWRTPASLPGDSEESGRGLFIYSLYADSIQFNETGNQVTLKRVFKQGGHDV